MIFNAGPVLDICTLVEEWGYWVTVRQKSSPHFLLEWSSNDWHVFKQHKAEARYFVHPEVPITYLGLHTRNRTVAEFQLGVWGIAPAQDSEAYTFLANILARLRNFRPNNVAAPNFNRDWFFERAHDHASGGSTPANSGHGDDASPRYLSGAERAVHRGMRGRHGGVRGALGRSKHRSLSVPMRRG